MENYEEVEISKTLAQDCVQDGEWSTVVITGDGRQEINVL